jgi:hypothetical protein
VACRECSLAAAVAALRAIAAPGKALQTVDVLLLELPSLLHAAAEAAEEQEELLLALAALHGALAQRHGFAGFLRELQSGNHLVLGWVRQPQRVAKQTAAPVV